MSRVRAVVAIVGLVVALAAVAVGPPSEPATAAGPRTLNVLPAEGLGNQVVLVTWSGFTETTEEGSFTVTVFQCKASPRSVADCYSEFRPPASGNAEATGVADGRTQSGGSGSAFLEVRPAAELDLGCDSANPCSVVAFENDGVPWPENALPASAVVAPLEFAPSPADCPAVDIPDVMTAGEGSASHAMYRWITATCTASRRLAIDYSENSSNQGRSGFLAGTLDVGITSMPAAAADSGSRTFTYSPIDVSAVAVVFNATDAVSKQRITEMTLTPRLVASLIAGSQPGGPGTHLFQDPEFVALNPGPNWPVNTSPPLLRAEQNADTHLLTRWLHEDSAARAFLDGNDPARLVDRNWKGVSYPTDIFLSLNTIFEGSYKPRNGTRDNVRRAFNFLPPGDGISLSVGQDGILGIVDVVSAQRFALPTAKLVPANGGDAHGVAPDQAGLTAGYQAMDATSAGAQTKQANVQAKGGAYPLTKIDYAMVPTSGIDAEKAENISRFVTFAGGDGQKPANLPTGYLPLPAAEAAIVAAANAAVLDAPNAKPPAGNPADPTNIGGFDSALGGFASALGSFDSGFVGAGGLLDDAAFDDALVAGELGAASTGAEGSGAPERSADGEPLSARFLGSQGFLVLPIVVVLGLLALIAGPTITFLQRRRAAAAAAVESARAVVPDAAAPQA